MQFGIGTASIPLPRQPDSNLIVKEQQEHQK